VNGPFPHVDHAFVAGTVYALSPDSPTVGARNQNGRAFGPGIVAGIADDDPSAVGTYSQVGARFGFTFVWAPLLALPIMAAAQIAASRIGVVQRQGLAAATKTACSAWLAYVVFVPVVLAGTFTLGADLHAMASAAHLVVPIPELLLLALLSVATLALQLFIPYRQTRQFLRVFALGIFAYFGVVFAAHVDWSRVQDAALVPRFAIGRGGIAALIAIAGAALSPYILVWQPSVEVEEAQLQGSDRGRSTSSRTATLDLVAGVTVAMLAACAILIASAATLRPAGITNVETADQAARALAPLLGDSTQALFALGILALGLLAVPILAGGAAFVTAELFGWRTGLGKKFRDAPGFYSVFLVAVAASLSLGAFGVPPVRALYLASIANGISAPTVLMVLLVLGRRGPRAVAPRALTLRRHRVDPDAGPHRVLERQCRGGDRVLRDRAPAHHGVDLRLPCRPVIARMPACRVPKTCRRSMSSTRRRGRGWTSTRCSPCSLPTRSSTIRSTAPRSKASTPLARISRAASTSCAR